MKQIIPAAFIIAVCLLQACNTQTPESNFNKIVLNTNVFSYFANTGIKTKITRGIGVKTVDGKVQYDAKGNAVLDTIPAEEMVDHEILFLQQSYEKVKSVTPDEEIKEMRSIAMQMYEMAIPVYENEYRQYAKMLDTHQPREKADSMINVINAKYGDKFADLAVKLRAIARPYAEKHNLNVSWGN